MKSRIAGVAKTAWFVVVILGLVLYELVTDTPFVVGKWLLGKLGRR